MSDSHLISNFVDMLRYRATHQPDNTAYVFLKHGETEEIVTTYQELDKQAQIIAAQLQSVGAEGERALLLYPPGPEYIAAFFGCLYAGVVAVPLYPPHPARLERTLPRLKVITKDASPFVALTTTAILSMAKLALSRSPEFRKVRWLATDSHSGKLTTRILNFLFSSSEMKKTDPDREWQYPVLNDDALAFLQYTSGSTGSPKGVMVAHDNLMYNSELIYKNSGHTADSYGVSWLPPYHDMGLIGGILQPIYGGFPVILMSPIAFLQKPMRWLQAITRYKGTSSAGPNFAFDLCVRKATPEDKAQLDLSSWEIAYNGAEPIRPDTLERFSTAFEPCGFRRETFYPCYGLAEATLIVSGGLKNALPVFKSVDANALKQNQIIPQKQDLPAHILTGCGKTLEGQEIVIANPETMRLCQENEIGEIWVSGKSVAKGYWQNSEATKENFQAYLADTGEGPFLRTGDLGFLCNRELFVTGRLKDLIIIRGRNHYPQDIELTTEQSYPRLRPGCSAAFQTEIDGEERLIIAAEVERRYKKRRQKSDNTAYEAERRLHARRKITSLPEYIPDDREDLNVEKAIHAIRKAVAEQHELQAYAVLLLKVGSIPKTSSGKIQRYACKQGFLNQTLNTIGSSILESTEITHGEDVEQKPELKIEQNIEQAVFASPDMSLEARQALLESYLIRLVSTVLKTNPSQIDIHQPLTALGLDSLMAIELQHRIENKFGFALPMTLFLECSGIVQLAAEILDSGSISDSKSSPKTDINILHPASEYQLSHNQKSLWFMYQLAPKSPAYNLSFAVRIISEADIPALRRAFQTLVSRHPSLRTVYRIHNGSPVQQINEDTEIYFKETDVSAWTPDEFNIRLSEDADCPFDLEKGPVLRVNLYTRSDDHILLLTIHHIATDLWSFSIILDELKNLYFKEKLKYTSTEIINGSEIISDAFPAVSSDPSYTAYVRWQSEMLSGIQGEHLWNYWKKQLGGELPVLNLLTDHPRPPVQTYNGAAYSFKINKEMTRKIKKLAKQSNATLYMILLAGFQVLLYRYTGQEDFLVGSPAAGRGHAEFENIIGYFVNPVVIRAELSGNLLFKELLGSVRHTVLEALAHQDYPFQLLVERLQPQRDPSKSPLFQVMFVLQKPLRMEESVSFVMKDPDARMMMGELELESLPLLRQMAQFDLMLMMAETKEELSASLEYNTDLFETDTICRMAGHFQRLLEGIVENPELPISKLPLLNAAERYQLLTEWNNTRTDYPRNKTIAEVFEAQAEKTPDHLAVIFENTQLSYKELNEYANGVAYFLSDKLNIKPDECIAVLMDRSHWMIAALLGILKSGGAYVPIDPVYPQERIRYILTASKCRCILTDEKHFPTIVSDYPDIRTLDVANITRKSSNPATQHDSNLAYVMFTSGSTGKPKGTLIRQQSVLRLVLNTNYINLGESDRILQTGSLAFDASTFEIWGALLNGGCVCLPPEWTVPDATELKRLVGQHGITTMWLTSTLFNQLAEADTDIFKGLKNLLVGGERLSIPHINKIKRAYPKLRLINGYGPTENTTFTACHQIEKIYERDIPIGKPIANTTIIIMDAHNELVPIGVPGEICTGGDGLAEGYLNDPLLTAEKFISHPFKQGERLYRIGDMGRWLPDGTIEFMGRNDDQVKIRGFRIELGEIEAVLAKHHSVRQNVVIVKEEYPGDKRLIGYIVPDQTQEISVGELRAFLKKELPDYMIPGTFVMLEKMPLISSGKVDRKALPEPSLIRPEINEDYIAPQNELEQTIAVIWQNALHLEKVGINDNFFDLGGHSLLIIQVQNNLQEILKKDISVVSLFRYPTIKSLAQYLSQENDTQTHDTDVQQIQDRAKKQQEIKKIRRQARLTRQ